MARRRMISLDVLDGDAFINCSLTARYLYLEMTARADDYGFCAGVSRIITMVGCAQGDLQELINCGLLIAFDTGVCLIADWMLSNKISPTKRQPTIHEAEAAQIRIVSKHYEMANSDNAECECLLEHSRGEC